MMMMVCGCTLMLGWEGTFISYVKVFELYPVNIKDYFNTEMKKRFSFSALPFYLPYKTQFQGSSNFPKLL